jgi:hypothetical protein
MSSGSFEEQCRIDGSRLAVPKSTADAIVMTTFVRDMKNPDKPDTLIG